jgi:hypothetical protein
MLKGPLKIEISPLLLLPSYPKQADTRRFVIVLPVVKHRTTLGAQAGPYCPGAKAAGLPLGNTSR